MSCNGCRVLRKGCSDNCVLRQCLRWIESSDAQGHATIFVAKFFGRAGMMSLISSVPESQRPALFQSLLYEACGRTINPVFGAVGLLCSGNWKLCQEAVETVMRGDMLCPASSGTGRPGSGPKFPNKVRLGRGYISSPSYTVTDDHVVDAGIKRQRTYESSEYDSSVRTKKACVEERVQLDLTLGCPPTTCHDSTTTRLSSPCHSSDSNTTYLSIFRPSQTEDSLVKQELLDLLH